MALQIIRDTPRGSSQMTMQQSSFSECLAMLATLHHTAFTSTADAVQEYLDFMMRATGARTAHISRFDGLYAFIPYSSDNDGCNIPAGVSSILENTFCQYVRASGAPVVVNDASHDSRVLHVPGRTKFDIGSYLGVPLLMRDGGIAGTLCVLDPAPRPFSQDHVNIARIVAGYLSLLLEKEWLFQTEQALTRHLDSTMDVLDERTAILKMVAHDIRNPLNSIQGYVQLLNENAYGLLSSKQHDVLERIHNATKYINRLTNDLTDTIAAEANTLNLLSYSFDPVTLGAAVLDSYQTQASERGIELRFESNCSVPMMVGDTDRLQQVLHNLMSNAMRYITKGSITLAVSDTQDVVQFSVADTGPGIPQSAQASIWQPHTRHSTVGNGLGLGLYIVRHLAEAMGGTAGVASTPGHGSTFWIQLPMQGAPPRRIAWADNSTP